MNIIKKILWFLFVLLLIPVIYLLVALMLSSVTVNKDSLNHRVDAKAVAENESTIYLSTNGVHLDIIMALDDISPSLQEGLIVSNQDAYLSFGWGDESFYLEVPTWSDLTAQIAFKAAFLDSSTLMHVKQYTNKKQDWVAVSVTQAELTNINGYIDKFFSIDETNKKLVLAGQGYGDSDNFYKAKGSYSYKNTCNTWVNRGFKQSGLTASYWTPFDKGLLSKYKK